MRIELYLVLLGSSKTNARKNCGYNIVVLQAIVPLALESLSRGLIWKYWNKTRPIIEGYGEGYIYGSEAFKMVYK